MASAEVYATGAGAAALVVVPVLWRALSVSWRTQASLLREVVVEIRALRSDICGVKPRRRVRRLARKRKV